MSAPAPSLAPLSVDDIKDKLLAATTPSERDAWASLLYATGVRDGLNQAREIMSPKKVA